MLRSPRPIRRPKLVVSTRYPIASIRYLPIPQRQIGPDLFQVLERRTSARTFEPLADDALAEFLWHAARTRETLGPETHQVRWERRVAPSAGGLHVVDLLAQHRLNGEVILSRYNAEAHALERLSVASKDLLQLWFAAQEVISAEAACVVWFSADREPLRARYKNFESLLWRDSGVLLGVSAIVAEALGLAFCALGITGGRLLSRALGNNRIFGCGAMMIGARSR